jgi:hypothetical protein
MAIFILCCALTGGVLGLRFKVLVLVPAIGLALVVTVFVGIARGDGDWAILGTAAAVATVLQIGYLAGTLARFAIGGSPQRAAAPGTDDRNALPAGKLTFRNSPAP